VDLVVTAPTEHLEEEPEAVTHPVGSRGRRRIVNPQPLNRGWVVLALSPAWLTLFLLVMAPNFMGAMLLNPPALLGLPAGVVILALALLWSAVGVLFTIGTPSTLVRTMSLVLFTFPALLSVLLGPAFILVILNLTI
jgi:hypothetical protein